MNCPEAAESVSALFDGEPLSREAAAHLSDCEECRARLNDYAEMGAELRDVVSASSPQALPEGQWRLAQPAPARNWFEKWRGTMRIPRFAFALMLITILALSGGLALVKARAEEGGPVLLLTFTIPPKGETLDCAVRTDRGPDSCGFFKSAVPGDLALSAQFIKREGERVRLGIKSSFQPWTAPSPERTVTFPISAFDKMPQKEYSFAPDRPLAVPVEGLGNIQVSGRFMGHVPVMVANPKEAYRWFQYEISGRDGKGIMNGTAPTNSAGNAYYDAEAGMPSADGSVWFHIRMLEQVGESERIGARTLWLPRGEPYGNQFYERLRSMPEREFLYSPGESLKIPVDGYGSLEIKGHLEAILPESVRMGRYPEDGKFRIDLPLILFREKEMLMQRKEDMEQGQVSMDKSYFAYGAQGEGWYVFSAKPFAGAAEGTLTKNQVDFKLDGQQYFLFASEPIIFGSMKIWVKHYASLQDVDPSSHAEAENWAAQNPQVAFGDLKNLPVEK